MASAAALVEVMPTANEHALQERVKSMEAECEKSYLRAKEAWDVVMNMVSERKQVTRSTHMSSLSPLVRVMASDTAALPSAQAERDIAQLKKDNKSLSADVAVLCEQLQATASAKLWKGLGYGAGKKGEPEPEPEAPDSLTEQSEQLLVRLEVEVER